MLGGVSLIFSHPICRSFWISSNIRYFTVDDAAESTGGLTWNSVVMVTTVLQQVFTSEQVLSDQSFFLFNERSTAGMFAALNHLVFFSLPFLYLIKNNNKKHQKRWHRLARSWTPWTCYCARLLHAQAPPLPAPSDPVRSGLTLSASLCRNPVCLFCFPFLFLIMYFKSDFFLLVVRWKKNFYVLVGETSLSLFRCSLRFFLFK